MILCKLAKHAISPPRPVRLKRGEGSKHMDEAKAIRVGSLANDSSDSHTLRASGRAAHVLLEEPSLCEESK